MMFWMPMFWMMSVMMILMSIGMVMIAMMFVMIVTMLPVMIGFAEWLLEFFDRIIALALIWLLNKRDAVHLAHYHDEAYQNQEQSLHRYIV